jgi:hypothetical protein
MLTILKNARKVAVVAVAAAALVPQVAAAKGGGGMGGSHSMSHAMAAPAYRRAPSHIVKKVTPANVSSVNATLPSQVGKVAPGLFGNTNPTTTNVPPAVSRFPGQIGKAGGLFGNTNPTTTNVPPAISRFPGQIGKAGGLFGNTSPTTTNVPPAVSRFPGQIGKAGGLFGNTTPTTPTSPTGPTSPTSPTQPTSPSGGFGGFPIGLGLGYGLGTFGGFGGGSGGGYGGGSGGMASAPVTSDPVASNPTSSPSATTAAATPAPAAAPTSNVVPASYAEAIGSADLVVEDIQVVEPATLVAGPAYRVKFRNQGSAAADAFQVGIFAALDNQLTSSQAVVAVPGLAAGATAEATLRLPQSAVKMVSTSSHQSGFDKLAVMVDVDQQVHENDKANNAAVVDRSSLEAAH